MSAEQYYDEHIAPKLAALAKECEEHGLSLLAICEWTPGEYGTTITIRDGSSFAMRMTEAAARSKGNLDSFMIAVERYARKYGHSSIYLRMRGVPATPNAE